MARWTRRLNGDVAIQLLLASLAAKAWPRPSASAADGAAACSAPRYCSAACWAAPIGEFCFYLFPTHIAVHSAYAVVGIGAVAASVIGAPLTMILLVFETTSDYTMTVGVAVGVMVATVITRRLFGFLLLHLALPSARRAAEGRLRCRAHVRHDRAAHPASRCADRQCDGPARCRGACPALGPPAACLRPARRWRLRRHHRQQGGSGETEGRRPAGDHRRNPSPMPKPIC